MALEPPIGSGVLALLTVLTFLIHRYRRRTRTSYTPNGTPKTTASSAPGSGYPAYPPSPPNQQHSPLSPNQSPGGTRLKKSNSAQTQRQLQVLSPRRRQVPIIEEEEAEMVMVTYEEGLKKLGLDKPQHILYPDPPTFDHEGEVSNYHIQPNIQSGTPPFSSLSSRPTPTTASLLTPGKTGQGQAQGYRQYDTSSPSPLHKRDSPEFSLTSTSRTNRGRSKEAGGFPTDSELMMGGIPSYYHDSSAGRYVLESPLRTP